MENRPYLIKSATGDSYYINSLYINTKKTKLGYSSHLLEILQNISNRLDQIEYKRDEYSIYNEVRDIIENLTGSELANILKLSIMIKFNYCTMIIFREFGIRHGVIY